MEFSVFECRGPVNGKVLLLVRNQLDPIEKLQMGPLESIYHFAS